jgi:hypothetical protein
MRGRPQKSTSSGGRARMERWYEREAGWDEINKGKDSPVMVQDKGVDIQASGERDNKRGSRRRSRSRCCKRDPKSTRKE